MKVRVVPTASKSLAVQVVRYRDGGTQVIKHIGSAKNRKEVAALKQMAREWIESVSGQIRLFPRLQTAGDALLFDKYRYLGFRYGLIAETVAGIFRIFGLSTESFPAADLFLDLVLSRIVEPGSKRNARKILSSLFGINHSLTGIYRRLSGFTDHQNLVEEKLVAFAKVKLGFDFHFVLYDITSLYFETFKSDRRRKVGFSKDNKPGQPQILVGLVVEKSGFPLSFSLFAGNKFEGKTLIPVILNFKRRHRIDNLTVVADAAMISRKNILSLRRAGLDYIVGARLGNSKFTLIEEISRKLNRVDGAGIKLSTPDGFLICHFSRSRYAKDKHERQKQLEKVNQILAGRRQPHRNRFLIKTSPADYSLNAALVEKTELLLGIKGYHTNLDLPEKLVIDRYRDLWQIEKSFRLTKNDLAARPVYHFKKPAITAHILICVTALAVCKWLDISTGRPAKQVIETLKSITDARMLNLVTGKEILMRSEIPEETSRMLTKISPH